MNSNEKIVNNFQNLNIFNVSVPAQLLDSQNKPAEPNKYN